MDDPKLASKDTQIEYLRKQDKVEVEVNFMMDWGNINEIPEDVKSLTIYGRFWDSEIRNPKVFEQIEDGSSRVKVLKTDAVWQGVTYREDKPSVVAEIKKLVDNGEYKEGLWK